MANNENLKPLNKICKEDAKKIRSKGGKARAKKIQERMTTEIADCIMKELDAKGVIVICEGVHFCMRSRGIKKQDASMVTSAIRGEFVDNFALRAEFLSLIK